MRIKLVTVKKRNILLINSFYYPEIHGGAEVMLQIQAEGFADRNFNVTVICRSHNTSLANEEIINGVKIIRFFDRPLANNSLLENFFYKVLFHLRDIYSFRNRAILGEILEIESPDLIFLHNLSGWSVSVIDEIIERKIPVYQVLHDQYFQCPKVNMYKNGKVCKNQCISCRLFRLPHRKVTKKISGVIGVSSFVVNNLVNNGFFRGVKQFVIHNARKIEFDTIRKINKEKTFTVGFIGTISKVKGIEILLEASLSLPDIKFIIAGKGQDNYVNSLKEKYRNKNIIFIGYQKPLDFFPMIDLLVVPSIWPDTFPGVVFESCGFGVPVLGSNIGGIGEIIQDNINGFLIEPGNVDELKSKLMTLRDNIELLQRLKGNSAESVKELLSESRMIEEYLRLIK